MAVAPESPAARSPDEGEGFLVTGRVASREAVRGGTDTVAVAAARRQAECSAAETGARGGERDAQGLLPVADAIVRLQRAVSEGSSYRPTTSGASTTGALRGCRLEPWILLVPRGGAVRIVQEDEVLHSLVIGDRSRPVAEAGLPFPGMEVAFTAGPAFEFWPVWCRIHDATEGWVAAAPEGPWSRTDETGTFSLSLAPGAYVLEAWHPDHGTTTLDWSVPTAEARAAGSKPTAPALLVFRSAGRPAGAAERGLGGSGGARGPG